MIWPFIYLASASPRRDEILTRMGVPHQVLHVPAAPGEDEPVLPEELPEVYVRRTAREKAQRAILWLSMNPGNYQPAPVLCADTTVILDGDILGKPANLDEAAEMLGRLSGKTHQVHTAVVLATEQGLQERVSISQVSFGAMDAQEIQSYCASGEPLGKAGAYGIQGRAEVFVRQLTGSYSGVMGLPMYETAELLRSLNQQ
jgi:septum formation protein